MTTYTEKDFAQANLATRGAGELARRADPEGWLQWLCSDGDNGEWWRGDENMAADGWVPVVESATHERTIEELRYDLKVAVAAVADLQEENDRLDRILQEPLSLKDMRVAWEAAYEEEECRKGDVLMTRHSDDNYEVWVSVEAFDISKKTRVLSRAPREPWADLADDLADRSALMGEGIIEAAAKALHLAGWRKTGGGDDE